jgi:hypothetical protein
MVYMSQAPSGAKNYDGSGNWFKVAELGAKASSSGLTWPSSGMTQFTFTLPKATPSGDYLIRFEQVGLHSAGAPQFYISVSDPRTSR